MNNITVKVPNVSWFKRSNENGWTETSEVGNKNIAVWLINASAYRTIGRYRRLKHRKSLTSSNMTHHLLCAYFPGC